MKFFKYHIYIYIIFIFIMHKGVHVHVHRFTGFFGGVISVCVFASSLKEELLPGANWTKYKRLLASRQLKNNELRVRCGRRMIPLKRL